MKVVILQPSYIPWRGHFHQIALADLFIFYDDVQYDKHGWRNRNRIKTANGPQWLTIPVLTSGLLEKKTPIKDIPIDRKRDWNIKHWQSIRQSYSKSPFFKLYEEEVSQFFIKPPDLLADFTIQTTISLTRMLGNNHTHFMRSSDMEGIQGTRTSRVIDILKKVGATYYYSGPSARNYVEPELFEAAGIPFEYMQYNYPEYPQLYPPYDPQVSILDLLFMTGPDAMKYIL